MSYDNLLPLLKKVKSNLSPQLFHERINIVFHDHEANSYDKMHVNMWDSLQEQINLLVSDLLKEKINLSEKLTLLDIGCGTGLSTQILLNSELGSKINEITLLDTSPNMLKYAEEKAKKWNKKYTVLNADVFSLKQKYDVIMICSVLHHIPDLEVFLKQVDSILESGGMLIHLQDPNAESLHNPNYNKRKQEFEKEAAAVPAKNKIKDLLPKEWKHFINRKLGRKNYIDLINDQLIAEKTIKKRMTADEMWSVTDIHVETNATIVDKGISLKFLKTKLPNFKLINQRTYGFYGALKSELTGAYKENEEKLILENDLSGRNISCIWIKN